MTFIDNKRTDYEEIIINGKEIYFFMRKDDNDTSAYVKWLDENILYSIDAQVSVIEVIKMVKSVE